MAQGGDHGPGGLCTDFGKKLVAATGASVVSAGVVVPLDVVKVQMMSSSVRSPLSGNATTSGACSTSGRSCAGEVPLGDPSRRNLLHNLRNGFRNWQPYANHTFNFASCSGGLVACPPRTPGGLPACPPSCFNTNTMFSTLSRILRQDGLIALWRGGGATLAMTIPSVGIYMPLYEHMLEHQCAGMGSAGPLVAGALSRGASVMCVAPLELIRTRLQAAQSRQPLQSVLGTQSPADWRARAAGVRMLWTGCGATLLRDVPFSALYWGMLEPMRSIILEQITDDPDQATPREVLAANIIAGATGGYLAAAATTPFDVIKTQKQVDARRAAMSISAVFNDVVSVAGWRGLLVGMGPRAIRSAPACAIVISTYEYLKKWMEVVACEQE